MQAVDEAQAVEAGRRARDLPVPGLSTISRHQDGAIRSHCPGVQRVGCRDREELLPLCGDLLSPAGAPVGGAQGTKAIHAPGMQGVEHRDRGETLQTRVPAPRDTSVGRAQDVVRADSPARGGVRETHCRELTAVPHEVLLTPRDSAVARRHHPADAADGPAMQGVREPDVCQPRGGGWRDFFDPGGSAVVRGGDRADGAAVDVFRPHGDCVSGVSHPGRPIAATLRQGHSRPRRPAVARRDDRRGSDRPAVQGRGRWRSWRSSETGERRGRQLRPSLVVRIAPPVPTTAPCWASVKATEVSQLEVPECWRVHVAPPSPVARITPSPQTAQPCWLREGDGPELEALRQGVPPRPAAVARGECRTGRGARGCKEKGRRNDDQCEEQRSLHGPPPKAMLP